MGGKRRRRRIKPRNPLVPAVRRLGLKIKPSAKSYSRKAKHRRWTGDNGGGAR